MSKASKVSHFHSTTYSAHRGGVAHATLGRPMAPSAPAPGTVGATYNQKYGQNKIKPQAQCVSFVSPNETMQQYANRVLGGSLAKLDGRVLMAGKTQASETIGALARKSVGNRNWANVTANEVFIAAFHQPMPAGMPVATCALTERASLDWYGVVHGTEDEPGTVGAMTPKFKYADRGSYIAFSSPDETMQQYANRVAHGSLAAIAGRQILLGGKLELGHIGELAKKAASSLRSPMGWGGVTVRQMYAAGGATIVPGMPIGSWPSYDDYAAAAPKQDQTSFGSGGGKGYSLQKRGTVTGAEEEADPTGVGLPADDISASVMSKKNPYKGGRFSPSFKPQAQCVDFLSLDETVQQYATRIAGGNISKIADRTLLHGGPSDYTKLGKIADLARKVRSRGWASVTAAQMFGASTGFHPSLTTKITSCDLTPRADLNYYGYEAVNGTEGTVGDFIDDAGDWVSTVVQESQNAFYNPDGQSGYTPPSANPGDNQTAAEQCANLGPGWSWSADRNDCVNFQKEAQACVDAGNTWDDVAGQCRSNNCPPGSHSNPDIPGCIPDKIPCGANSFQSGDKCLCEKGFEFKDMVSLDCVPIGQGWQSAIKKCGPGTHNDPNVGGCVCDQGYIFDPKRTTADTLVCGKAECGANSVLGPDGCRCKPGYDWVDPANMDNLDCKKVGGPGTGPVAPVAPKCGPGTHVDNATNTCVVDETKQGEGPAKEEDNTWKWVAGIAAAAVVVGGGTYLAMKKDKKGQKSALQAKLSSHSTQTDVS